jgi:DNA-binding transcriptional LysR family regulator
MSFEDGELRTMRDPAKRRSWKTLGLDLVTLRVFLSTAEEGTMGRAAERENIALSAISRRISDLEARTNLILFDRRDRGMSLTSAGRALAQSIRLVFDRLDALARGLNDLESGETGYIRLFHQTAASALLPPILADFLTTHPGIQLEIDEAAPDEILHAVRSGDADLGIITSWTAADALDLESRPWVADELVAIIPIEHPLSSRDTLSVAEICEFPIITLRNAQAVLVLFREAARKRDLLLQERVHAVSYETVRHMVAAGLGIAIVPQTAAERPETNDRIAVRRLSEEWAQRRLIICSRGVGLRSAASTLLLEHLAASSVEREESPSGR